MPYRNDNASDADAGPVRTRLLDLWPEWLGWVFVGLPMADAMQTISIDWK
jgi:hypothetical protein